MVLQKIFSFLLSDMKRVGCPDTPSWANKLFWVFLIGIFSLANIRNSYLYNIDNKEKMMKVIKCLDKELQGLKQVNNEKHIEP